LDLRKITPDMRDAGGAVKISSEGKGGKAEDSNHKSDNGSMSTDISPDK
jgi:hypothetical protein